MDLVYSPVAVLLPFLICTVISAAIESLRTSTGCTDPSFSLTIYVDWLKLIDTAIQITNDHWSNNRKLCKNDDNIGIKTSGGGQVDVELETWVQRKVATGRHMYSVPQTSNFL